MELQTLKNLIKQGEGAHLEFKLKANHPEKIIKEIAAFANTKGGLLLVGIGDNKEIIGLKYPDEDEYLLIKAISSMILPNPEYVVEKVSLDNDKTVLVFRIFESKSKPVYVGPENKLYVRSADKSIQGSKEIKEILKGQSKNKSYKFRFGDNEKTLMEYLDLNQYITLQKFSEICNLNPKFASRTLILLVLAGLLKIVPHELEDHFLLK